MLYKRSPINLKSPDRIVGMRTLPVTSNTISVRGLGLPENNIAVISMLSSGTLLLEAAAGKVDEGGEEIGHVHHRVGFGSRRTCPGQRIRQGTRTPPSNVVFLVPRIRPVALFGQAAIVVGTDQQRVVAKSAGLDRAKIRPTASS